MKNLFIFFILALFISACSQFDITPVEKEYSWEQDSKGNWYLNAASYNRCILIDTSISGKQIIISSHSDDLSSDGFLIVSEIENDTPVVVRRLDVFSKKVALKIIDGYYYLILQDRWNIKSNHRKFYNTIVEFSEDWEFIKQAHICLSGRMERIVDIYISQNKLVAMAESDEHDGFFEGSFVTAKQPERQKSNTFYFPNSSVKFLRYNNDSLCFLVNKHFVNDNYFDFDSVMNFSIDKAGRLKSSFASVVNAERNRCKTGEVLQMLPPMNGFSTLEFHNSESNQHWIDTLPDYSHVFSILALDSGKFLYYIRYEPGPFSMGAKTSIELLYPDKRKRTIKNIEWRFSEMNIFRFDDRDILFWKQVEQNEVFLLYEKPFAGRGYPMFFEILDLSGEKE